LNGKSIDDRGATLAIIQHDGIDDEIEEEIPDVDEDDEQEVEIKDEDTDTDDDEVEEEIAFPPIFNPKLRIYFFNDFV